MYWTYLETFLYLLTRHSSLLQLSVSLLSVYLLYKFIKLDLYPANGFSDDHPKWMLTCLTTTLSQPTIIEQIERNLANVNINLSFFVNCSLLFQLYTTWKNLNIFLRFIMADRRPEDNRISRSILYQLVYSK